MIPNKPSTRPPQKNNQVDNQEVQALTEDEIYQTISQNNKKQKKTLFITRRTLFQLS